MHKMSNLKKKTTTCNLSQSVTVYVSVESYK